MVARRHEGRKAEPTGGVIDSQSVKTTEGGGPCGYDAGKKVKGRKRHIVTDTLGFLLSCIVHEANIQDRDGAHGIAPSLGSTAGHWCWKWSARCLGRQKDGLQRRGLCFPTAIDLHPW